MQTIINQDALTQYKKDMTIYGIEVNRRRSVPEVRDGLKLVQRRILDIMFNHDSCERQLVKTAAIVGKVIAINHPHGDASVEDAIKPMVNWFEIGVPLIYSESNTGNMQGTGAASKRYTEIRLSKFALDCIISEMRQSKQVVDWVPTFDGREMEPEYFPVTVPVLLINGTYGIGVGLKTEIPKHNIGEVIDATINLIKNPNYQVVLIPDQCMKCEIIDTNWKAISNKGHGKYIVRGIIDIEEDKNPTTIKRYGQHQVLVIKSTPDRVWVDKGKEENGGVKYKILDMIKDGKLPQIVYIEEDSHENNMRIVIHLKRGSDPNFVRDTLYKTTQLQDTYNINFEVLNGIEPLRMSYKSYLEFFIEQRKITKFRLYCNKLEQVRTEYHKKDAFIKALESGEIDNIIYMIRSQTGSVNDSATAEYLIKKLKITDIQAKYIMDANIKHLSNAYLNKYKKELQELELKDKEYLEKITNDNLLLQEIIDDLKEAKAKYGKPRQCVIINKSDVDQIPKGNFKLIFTENGYIKKINQNEFAGSFRGDNPLHILKVENTENVLIFTEQGKVYKLPVCKVPVTEKNSIGTDLRILAKGLTSKITKVIYEPTLIEISKKINKYFLITITAGNCIKKLDLEDFLNVAPSGLLYTKLNDGDYVKDIIITPNNLDVIIYSDRKALRIPANDIPHYKRSTLGVSAMNTSELIDGISVVYPDCTDIVVVTESGRINKFDVSGLNISARYKAGSSVIKLSKTDRIHSIFGVNDSNVLKIFTKNSKIDVNVNELKRGSSISSGDKIISTKGDIIVKCEVYKSK